MKEIVIISGKGGTGKSSICCALAHLWKEDAVIADCDVDAADMHLILHPQSSDSKDFFSGVKAIIDPKVCSSCGLCASVCRFDAIRKHEGKYLVNELDCEGCAYCYHICPTGAISIPEQNVGQYHISQSRLGCTLVHAALNIGAENSGKLVSKVKSEARHQAKLENKEFLLVDGSPGIGCPVIASLSGAHFVVLVTEVSKSGLSDLKRVWELVKKFKIPGACILNKADINPDICKEMKEYLHKEKILNLGEIPYSEDFPAAISMGKTLIEQNESTWRPVFENMGNAIKEKI
ncbi:MAG: ATP-binding protein [Candidatus Cloacimonadales bacterium]|mgnify:CR=1 FL=1|jgi:MinD superfamily P-loop ATPase|nr:ATP-binding protein [Candidatus Cloacimonadota bacterium]MDY0381681.1 ATP-binding protein [Candidatus Cloacimonadaceae bacterium]HCM15051.1 (4Fe-4S)-binding protein [Candidatus Cloacimonas sp.]MCB5257377.1 ATP-binding protein [Candidatus Cloacimonadota bacterium]MCB5263742.1 ATP-binding protein [Candidatus Cloacimonadota bacterium]